MLNRRRHPDLRSERGQTAVEFALIAPMLIALLLGIVQGGIAFHSYITVTDAARAAARKAILARVQGLTATDITNAADAAAADLDASKISVVTNPPDPSTAAAGSTVTVTVSYPYDINVLGIALCSGCTLHSTVTERVE